MHYVRESYVYYLWSVLLSLYDRSALCHALTAAGHWCKRQIADSKAAAVLSREGLLTQSWESSRLCRYLTYLANSPIYLLRIVYQKLKSLFKGSKSRSEIVATFLAILELCKTNSVSLEDDVSGENPNVRLLDEEALAKQGDDVNGTN